METLPNWIDLIVITLVLRTCYNGFGRGLLTELLSLIGAVSSTSLTLNYAGVVSKWVTAWVPTGGSFMRVGVFWGFLLTVTLVVRIVLRRAAEVIKWERLHWAMQGMGLVLGGLRGLWWSGFLLVVLSSSGVAFLRQSVEERSMFGPRLLHVAREGLARAADRFPGARGRGPEPVPPITTPSAS